MVIMINVINIKFMQSHLTTHSVVDSDEQKWMVMALIHVYIYVHFLYLGENCTQNEDTYILGVV